MALQLVSQQNCSPACAEAAQVEALKLRLKLKQKLRRSSEASTIEQVGGGTRDARIQALRDVN